MLLVNRLTHNSLTSIKLNFTMLNFHSYSWFIIVSYRMIHCCVIVRGQIKVDGMNATDQTKKYNEPIRIIFCPVKQTFIFFRFFWVVVAVWSSTAGTATTASPSSTTATPWPQRSHSEKLFRYDQVMVKISIRFWCFVQVKVLIN